MPNVRASCGEHNDILDLSEPISVHREQPDDAELENIPERFLIMKYAHDEISSQICFQKNLNHIRRELIRYFLKFNCCRYHYNSIAYVALRYHIPTHILYDFVK